MAKGEFLMRAKALKKNQSGWDFIKKKPSDWYISEKLNGMRVFWDGGISRGLKYVPWSANNKKTPTGLWSRYGMPVYAPQEWIMNLPENLFLDGELYSHNLSRQEIISTVKKLTPVSSEWERIRLWTFDSPNPVNFFQTRDIEYKALGIAFKINLFDCMKIAAKVKRARSTYKDTYQDLFQYINPQYVKYNCILHEQKTLRTEDEYKLFREEIREKGGEGLMIRGINSEWVGQQSQYLWKDKFVEDGEAIICDWKKGLGKYAGMLGSLVVSLGLKEFELSGMTDELREWDETYDCPKHFKLGQRVNFTYSSLSDSGIPIEARFNSVMEEG